mmetsp:Transcript_7794/g.12875  ORF Transcript_7794/g.12875 Transcript_7794/m.12875 type:complete len:90 (-) Transcript_7794:124-393(-)
MEEALIVAVMFLFFVGHAVRIFERNYDDMLTSIEVELERQAMENYSSVKEEMASLPLQGLPCIEDDECRHRASKGKQVAITRPTYNECV